MTTWKRKVPVDDPQVCQVCRGFGGTRLVTHVQWVPCRACNGTGRVHPPLRLAPARQKEKE